MERFGDLKGKTLSAVSGKGGGDELRFTLDDGRVAVLWHDQDCCESVLIDDICGQLSDLVGSPITFAEESSNDDANSPSTLWTFYRIGTAKGFVVIRWCGESEYYSVSVDFKVEG